MRQTLFLSAKGGERRCDNAPRQVQQENSQRDAVPSLGTQYARICESNRGRLVVAENRHSRLTASDPKLPGRFSAVADVQR